MTERRAPGHYLLVGGDVAVELGIGNVVIAEVGKIHRHGVPSIARGASYLGAIKICLEAAAVANIDHLVGDVECDLAGEKRCGLDTSADCPKILYSE